MIDLTFDQGQSDIRFRRLLTAILLATVVLLSVLPYMRDLSFYVGYAPTVVASLALTLFLLVRSTSLVVPKYAVALLSIIWLVYFYHLMFGTVSQAAFVRVPVFVLFSILTLFYVPYRISLNDFALVVTIVTTCVVALGLLTLLIGDYHIFIFDVTQWRWSFKPIPPVALEIYPIKSVFQNPNPFSHFALIGTFSSAMVYFRYRTRILMLCITTNAVGLYLSNSRSAAFALVMGTCFALLAIYGYKRYLVPALYCTIAGIALVVMVWLGVFPAIGPIEAIDLTGRRSLWQGAVHAGLKRPIAGFGPGDVGTMIEPFVPNEEKAGGQPHSSYFRMLVTTGIFGLLAYVTFLLMTANRLARRISDPTNAILYGLVVALIVHMNFEFYSLFGISSTSLLTSLVFGYALAAIVRGTEDER
jgi:O-antigen ligase